MSKMNNRVYGIVGINAEMANWNADFTMNPKTLGDGTIFGSDKALKYSIKNLWDIQGKDVLYRKSLAKGKKEGEIDVRDLGEKFKTLTGKEDLKKVKDDEIVNDLLSFVDVENFGATFAVKELNRSITGVVQVGQGVNVVEDTEVHVMDIVSPFRNSNEKSKDSKQTSIGKKVFADKAIYVYPFSVNPYNLDGFKESVEGFEGYTREAYEAFKEGACLGATALNTNSKSGTSNGFSIFIELKEGSKRFLPDLNGYIAVEVDDEGLATIDVSKLENLVKGIEEEVESAEVFVDPSKFSVEGADSLDVKNIILDV